MNTPAIQTVLAIIVAALLVTDWRQTLVIADNPQRWREINPIMGQHPTRSRVHAWFAFVGLVCAAIAVVAWGHNALTYAGLAFGAVELIFVVDNYQIGIRV